MEGGFLFERIFCFPPFVWMLRDSCLCGKRFAWSAHLFLPRWDEGFCKDGESQTLAPDQVSCLSLSYVWKIYGLFFSESYIIFVVLGFFYWNGTIVLMPMFVVKLLRYDFFFHWIISAIRIGNWGIPKQSKLWFEWQNEVVEGLNWRLWAFDGVPVAQA